MVHLLLYQFVLRGHYIQEPDKKWKIFLYFRITDDNILLCLQLSNLPTFILFSGIMGSEVSITASGTKLETNRIKIEETCCWPTDQQTGQNTDCQTIISQTPSPCSHRQQCVCKVTFKQFPQPLKSKDGPYQTNCIAIQYWRAGIVLVLLVGVGAGGFFLLLLLES